MHYLPLTLPFFIALFTVFAFVVVLIEMRILQYAYEAVGVERRYLFILLLASFLGSYINIPVAHLPAERVVSPRIVDVFGVPYVIPEITDSPGTVIAVNVGGAVVPFALSVYLIAKNRFPLVCAVGVGVVAFVVHLVAYPVPGLGIAEPAFVPPLAAAAVALLLSRRRAAPLAYVSGSLGSLIGADLLNLGALRGLGAPVASIGGAGKFDGIFLTGIIAVFLASLASRRLPPSRAENPPHGGGTAA